MATFTDIFNSLPSESKLRGDAFEDLCKYFLEHDEMWAKKIKNVWLWYEWPERDDSDVGIDIIFEDTAGALGAVQCKGYSRANNVGLNDINSFLVQTTIAAKHKFEYKLLMTTSDLGTRAAETVDRADVIHIPFTSFEKASFVWPDYWPGLNSSVLKHARFEFLRNRWLHANFTEDERLEIAREDEEREEEWDKAASEAPSNLELISRERLVCFTCKLPPTAIIAREKWLVNELGGVIYQADGSQFGLLDARYDRWDQLSRKEQLGLLIKREIEFDHDDDYDPDHMGTMFMIDEINSRSSKFSPNETYCWYCAQELEKDLHPTIISRLIGRTTEEENELLSDLLARTKSRAAKGVRVYSLPNFWEFFQFEQTNWFLHVIHIPEVHEQLSKMSDRQRRLDLIFGDPPVKESDLDPDLDAPSAAFARGGRRGELLLSREPPQAWSIPSDPLFPLEDMVFMFEKWVLFTIETAWKDIYRLKAKPIIEMSQYELDDLIKFNWDFLRFKLLSQNLLLAYSSIGKENDPEARDHLEVIQRTYDEVRDFSIEVLNADLSVWNEEHIRTLSVIGPGSLLRKGVENSIPPPW